MSDDTEQPEPDLPGQTVDAAFVEQTLLSVAGLLRLVQHGLQPSAEEAKELEDRIGQILPYISRPATDTPS